MALTENMLAWNKRIQEQSRKDKKEDTEVPSDKKDNKMIYN
jgi:hypothetical protein